MARINHVKRSRKQWKCGCGATIEIGQPYKHASPGFRGRKIVKCDNCSFKQSELCTSKLSEAYAAQETAEEAFANWGGSEDMSELENILEEMASDLEQVRDEYEDSLGNMPDGLQEGDVGQEMQEKIDGLDEWADELRGVETDLDDDEFSDEGLDFEEMEDKETKEQFIERKQKEHYDGQEQERDEIKSAAEEAIGNCPF